MTDPVVAIGLDAAPLPLIERWIAKGRLPAMARLFEQGARAPLAAFESYVAELTWPSFITGVTATMFAGQTITGACISLTVTLNEQLA